MGKGLSPLRQTQPEGLLDLFSNAPVPPERVA